MAYAVQYRLTNWRDWASEARKVDPADAAALAIVHTATTAPMNDLFPDPTRGPSYAPPGLAGEEFTSPKKNKHQPMVTPQAPLGHLYWDMPGAKGKVDDPLLHNYRLDLPRLDVDVYNHIMDHPTTLSPRVSAPPSLHKPVYQPTPLATSTNYPTPRDRHIPAVNQPVFSTAYHQSPFVQYYTGPPAPAPAPVTPPVSAIQPASATPKYTEYVNNINPPAPKPAIEAPAIPAPPAATSPPKITPFRTPKTPAWQPTQDVWMYPAAATAAPAPVEHWVPPPTAAADPWMATAAMPAPAKADKKWGKGNKKGDQHGKPRSPMVDHVDELDNSDPHRQWHHGGPYDQVPAQHARHTRTSSQPASFSAFPPAAAHASRPAPEHMRGHSPTAALDHLVSRLEDMRHPSSFADLYESNIQAPVPQRPFGGAGPPGKSKKGGGQAHSEYAPMYPASRFEAEQAEQATFTKVQHVFGGGRRSSMSGSPGGDSPPALVAAPDLSPTVGSTVYGSGFGPSAKGRGGNGKGLGRHSTYR